MRNMKNPPRLTYVQRRSTINSRQIVAINQKQVDTPSDQSQPAHTHFQPSYHRESSFVKVPTRNEATKKPSIITPSMDQLSTLTTDMMNLKSRKRWFNHLTPKKQNLFKLAIVFLVLIVVSVAVIPPVYLLIFRQSNEQSSSFSNLIASICSATTCIGKETPYRTSMVTYLYPFDYNTNDLTGYATAVPFGTGSISYTSYSYIGTGALNLNSPSNFQYVQIPYVDLRQSFTIETWIYPQTTIWPEQGLFSQCDWNLTCIAITIRNNRVIFTLDSMNSNSNSLMSSTLLVLADWTHIAVVYDATISQLLIYISGRLDAISSSRVSSYKGSSLGSITTIGKSLTYTCNYTYFIGRIDHFTISAGIARNVCQIINDGSLVAYFPFNSQTVYNDYSVNMFHGLTQATTTITQGPVGNALYFSTNTSYFQSKCYPHPDYTTPPFTFALWINPDSLTGGGSLIHSSNWQNGSGANCFDILALTSTGSIVAQILANGGVSINATQGPIIPANTWTHIAMVFSSTYGIRIYINGELNVVSSGINMNTWNYYESQYITLGNNSPLGPSGGITCKTGTIPVVSGSFKGGLDEFRFYNRELDSQEICVLANR